MDASPDVLAETVRARRSAVDRDLEALGRSLRRADPRQIDVRRWATRALPIAAGAAALVVASRRRRVSSLEQLLVHGLTDLYHAEQQLIPALGHMAARATNPDLRSAFEQHRVETEAQLERLVRVFRSIGTRPRRRGVSAGVTGIIAEGERLLKRKVEPRVRDAWLIASAQRVEHFEIATYGTVRTYAGMLGYTYAAELLQETLEEEKAADERLTLIAERFVNPDTIRQQASA